MKFFPAVLPALTGRRGTVLRILYWLLAAATVIVVAGSMIFNGVDFFRNVPATMAYGFRTYTAQHRVQIGEVGSDEARATGLAKGRWLTAIDDTALPRDATEYWVGAKLAEQGGAVVLTVRDDAGRITRHRLTRQDRVWRARDPSSGVAVWAYAVLTFVSLQLLPLFLLAASLLLALRRPRDAEAMLFATGFLLLCFNSDVAFWLNAFGGAAPALLTSLMMLGWVATLIAVAGFPDGRFVTRSARLVPAGLAALGIAMALLPLAGRVAPVVAPYLNLTAFGLVALAAYAVLSRYRQATDVTQRQQIKWVAMGFAITAVAVLSLIPLELMGVSARRGDPIAFLIFVAGRLLLFLPLPIGLLVSLLRYRLYDADAAISRSAAYALLTVTLLAIFAVTEKSVEILGAEYLGGSLGTVAGGIGAALAAVAIAPLHHRMMHWAEHRFQKGLVRLRIGLPALVGDLRETAGPTAIGDAVLARIDAGVRAKQAAILMDGATLAVRGLSNDAVVDWRRGWIAPATPDAQCDRDDAVFPLRVPLTADGCGDVGWLLLGPRPDGSFYGKDERAALAGVADPIARALAIARDRAINAATAVREAQGLQARIASLEATVGRLLGAMPS